MLRIPKIALLVSASFISLNFPALVEARDAGTTAEASDRTVAKDGGPVAAGSGHLEIIVVTARRREETLQDVPIAISALSGEELERRGINSTEDLRNTTPGLNISGLSRDKANFFIRGQQPGNLAGLARNIPGVATYFAEVPTNVAGPGFFYDLANVQVLKGPQGTLFGRNTTGGAVLLEPARPDMSNGGFAQAQTGNYDLRQFNGVLNVAPIPSILAIRIATDIVDRDGFTRSIVTGQDQDDRRYEAFRASFLFTPSDRFENLTIVDYRNKDQNGSGQVIRAIQPATVLGAPIALDEQTRGALSAILGRPITQTSIPLTLGGTVSVRCLQAALPGCPAPVFGSGALGALAAALQPGGSLYILAPNSAFQEILDTQAQIGPRYNQNDLNSSIKERTFGVVNKTHWDITDSLRLKNVISFRKERANEVLNYTGTPLPIINTAGGANGAKWGSGIETFTEELQFQGRFDGMNLSYIVGGYYEKAEPGFQQSSIGNQVGSVELRYFDYSDTSKALFGHLEWSPLDWLGFSGGIRRTRDSRALTQSRTTLAGVCNQSDPITPTVAACPLKNSASFEATTYDMTVSFTPAEDMLFYASYRRGYKSGGLNVPIPPAPAPFAIDAFAKYGAEIVDDFEIGAKVDFNVGIPVRLNLAAFHDNYKDQQIVQTIPIIGLDGRPTASQAIRNIAASRIEGIEGQITLKPFDFLTLGAFGSYLEAEPKQALLTDGGVPMLLKRQLPNQPKSKWGANTVVELPLAGDNGTFIASADYSWQSSYYTAVTPTLVDSSPAYGVLNARIGWDSVIGSNVDVAVFANNLTDKTYVLGGYPIVQLGIDSAIYGEPRMYGVSFKVRFGSFK